MNLSRSLFLLLSCPLPLLGQRTCQNRLQRTRASLQACRAVRTDLQQTVTDLEADVNNLSDTIATMQSPFNECSSFCSSTADCNFVVRANAISELLGCSCPDSTEGFGRLLCATRKLIASTSDIAFLASWSLQFDQRSNHVVAYIVFGPFDLELSRCPSGECDDIDDFETITIDTTVTDVSLSLDRLDRPVLAYRKSTAQPTLNLARCEQDCTDPDDFSILTLDADTTGNNGLHPSLALDQNDNPVIAYGSFDTSSNVYSVKVIRCLVSDACGSASDFTDITIGTAAAFSQVTLALDQHDNPVVVYRDSGSILRLARCLTPEACSDASDYTTIAVSNDIVNAFDGSISLVIDEHGNPVIGYVPLATTTTAARLARCLVPEQCTSTTDFTVVTFPSSAPVFATSVALDPTDGRLWFAYFTGQQSSTQDLVLAACDGIDSNCTNASDFVNGVVLTNNAFGSMHLSLDANGQPRVDFVDSAGDVFLFADL